MICILLPTIISCSSNKHVLRDEISEITGINIENQSITFGTPAHPLSGKPKKPENGWYRATNLEALEVPLSMIDSKDNISNFVSNSYLVQYLSDSRVFPIGDGHLSHKPQMYFCGYRNLDKSNSIEKPNIFPNDVSLEQIFSKTAINQAIVELENKANLLNLILPIDFVTKFELELKNQIEQNSSSSLNLLYIVATISDGQILRHLSNDRSRNEESYYDERPYNVCNTKNVISGIAGLMFVNFNLSANLYVKDWFENAFSLSLDGPYSNDLNPLFLVVSDLSLTWARRINTKVKTSIKIRRINAMFYPIWFKSSSIKEL